MPTSTWGNGIDMPGPTPKEYREHKVNKVKELDSEKWAQVKMCKRMVKDSKPWKGLARKELAKHAAKYEYTKRSMALTAPSASCRSCRYPPVNPRGWSGRGSRTMLC